MSLTRLALDSLKWSMLAEAASKAIGPLVFIILARILVPEDFGIVAVATIVISFSQVFWDAGLAKALIQHQERIADATHVVFWINLCLGMVLLLLLLAAADPIASFFGDARIAPVMRVMAFQLPIAALGAVPTALFQKDFQFRKLFWIRLIATSAPALVSLPLALHGGSYWALVAGAMAGQAAHTLALWWHSPWRPRRHFDRKLALELWRFGQWALLSALLGWFFLWMDSIVVGHFLDTHEMGVYRVGNTFVAMVMSLIAGPVLPIAYSAFSRSQHDHDQIRRGIIFGGKALALLILPLGFGLFLLGDLVAAIIFGKHWSGIDDVIGWLAITQALAYTISIKQEAYRAIGRPDLEARIMLISMIIRIPFYLLSVQYGLKVFVLARLASTLLGIANHLVFATLFLKIGVTDYMRMIGPALLASLVMLGFGQFAILPMVGGLQPVIQAGLVVVACAAFYLGLIAVVDRPFLRQGYRFVKDGRDGVATG